METLLLALLAGVALAEPDCAPPSRAMAVWWVGPRELEPGQSVPLQAVWTDRPGSFIPVPEECVGAVASSSAEFVSVSAGGGLVRVAPDAPAGLRATLSATVGDRPITGEIRVIDRRATPLPGVWRQVAARCVGGAAPEPVRELTFDADGRFTVTWRPFETYRDYWGPYAYDPASGRLGARVEGGDNVPPRVDLDGQARVSDDGRLVLTGVAFGDPNDRPGLGDCEIEFAR